MNSVLYITANPNDEAVSYSLRLGREFIKAYQEVAPRDHIIHLDLYQAEIPLIDRDILSAWRKLDQYRPEEHTSTDHALAELTEREVAKLNKVSRYTDQFVAAD